MVYTCCVPGCSTGNNGKLDGKSMHSFPRDEAKKEEWLQRIRREGFLPTKYSKICSLHFELSDFQLSRKDTNVTRLKNCGSLIRRKLKDDASPSLFPTFSNLPSHAARPCKRPKTDSTSPVPSKHEAGDLEEVLINEISNCSSENLTTAFATRISDADLPSVIAQSANGELVANLNLPSGSGWGPFKYVPCGSRDIWDLRWRKDDGEYEHVKMISPTEKWLLNLKLTSDSKLANSQLLVDTAKQIVFCDISREIKRGEVVINLPKIMGTIVKEPSPTAGFVCPYCGIAFTKATTLQAHVGQYCRKRPNNAGHLEGAPIKRCRSTSPPDEPPALYPAAVLMDRKSEAMSVSQAPPLPPHHGLSPTVPLSPSLLPGAAAAAAHLTPLKYCIQCRLFFANDELFQMHLRLGANLNALSGHGLVLSAPVITSTGLQYIPVHGAASLSPQPPPSQPAPRGLMPEEVSSMAASVAAAATNGALPSMMDGSCSPSLPLDLSFRTHGALSPPNALHCLSKKAAPVAPKRQLSEAELAAIPRPFQCQFCQTRFRSVKTLRAHQESYCQGGARVEVMRGVKPARSQAAAAVAKAVSGTNAVTAIIPTLAAQLRPMAEADLEGCWHPTDQGFRCYLCGYVGQTVRGMKLHSKLHRQPPPEVPPSITRENSSEQPPALEAEPDQTVPDSVPPEPEAGTVAEGPVSPALSSGGAPGGHFKCRECEASCASLDLLLEHMRSECPQPSTPVKKEVVEQEGSE